MKPHYLISLNLFFILGVASGCTASKENSENHPALGTYQDIRNHLINRDLDSAPQLTTDPNIALSEWKAYSERLGGNEALAGAIEKSLDNTKIHSIRDADEYAMILIALPENKYSPVSAEFYIRDAKGRYLELVEPSMDIPYPLLQHFYTTKGEPDAEFTCRG